MVFQDVSLWPQVVHFLRNLTVTPSWLTMTAPRPAVARPLRGGGSRRRASAAAGGSTGGAAMRGGGGGAGVPEPALLTLPSDRARPEPEHTVEAAESDRAMVVWMGSSS